MICPVCNTQLEKDAKKCFVCGCLLNQKEDRPHSRTNRSKKTCPVCRALVDQEAFSCPICGVSLEQFPAEEHAFWEFDSGITDDAADTTADMDSTADVTEQGSFQNRNREKDAEPGRRQEPYYEASKSENGYEVLPDQKTKTQKKGKEPGYETSREKKEIRGQEASAGKPKDPRAAILLILTAVLLALAGILTAVAVKVRRTDTNNAFTTEAVTEEIQSETVEEDTGTEQETQTAAEEPEEPITEEPAEPVTAERTKPIRIDEYCGAWNVQNRTDRELILQKLTDDAVLFSLWYYGIDVLDHVTAYLERNTAYFSTDVDGGAVEGALIFNENSIVVQITKSNRATMPVETMDFAEWHEKPWAYEKYGIDESAVVQYVDVIAPIVYIYDGPGYDYNIVGVITDQNTYRIIDTVEGIDVERRPVWGKLLSGLGWININDAVEDEFEEYAEYDFILPNSATELLTYDDISGLSSEQLRFARNEIYARHGRKFDDEELRAYFESRWWYRGIIETADFSDEILSETERSNAAFILTYE